MSREVTIDKHDRNGCFVAVIETSGQGPIVMETEGEDSSYEAAEARIARVFGGKPLRHCICRLVPVAGNELLPLDLQRMQK